VNPSGVFVRRGDIILEPGENFKSKKKEGCKKGDPLVRKTSKETVFGKKETKKFLQKKPFRDRSAEKTYRGKKSGSPTGGQKTIFVGKEKKTEPHRKDRNTTQNGGP